MSNIFKIYVNNNNEDNENVLSDLYLFIKNKYFKDDLEESCEALNESYSESYIDFLESEIFTWDFQSVLISVQTIKSTIIPNSIYDEKIIEK